MPIGKKNDGMRIAVRLGKSEGGIWSCRFTPISLLSLRIRAIYLTEWMDRCGSTGAWGGLAASDTLGFHARTDTVGRRPLASAVCEIV